MRVLAVVTVETIPHGMPRLPFVPTTRGDKIIVLLRDNIRQR